MHDRETTGATQNLSRKYKQTSPAVDQTSPGKLGTVPDKVRRFLLASLNNFSKLYLYTY
jgi:hypothetical protein